ncbi:MAG: beta-propeller domain-containing protein [Candidatus Izemoplasmatales bacterium]
MKSIVILKRFIVLSLFVFFVGILSACQSGTFPTTTKETNLVSEVGSFTNYAALQSYLETYYTNNYGDYYYRGDLVNAVTDESIADAPQTTDNSTADFGTDGSADYSKTNDQVEGVNESDRILTDGRYIYVITNSTFFMIDASNLEIVNQFSTENSWYIGMYLTDDSVILLSSEYNYDQNEYSVDDKMGGVYYYYRYSYGIRVNVYSLEDPENLTVTKSLYFDSSNLVSSRVINNTLYLVMDNYQIYYGYDTNHFIPEYTDSAIGDEVVTVPANQIYYMPNDTTSMGYLILASVNLGDDSPADVSAYLGSSYQIYMSLDNLYTTVYRYDYIEETSSYTQTTYILRFQIDEGRLVYQACGEIYGVPLDQFSMDEYDGVFRIATTTYSWASTGSRTTNQLFLLDATSTGEMNLISVLGGLGKENERIYAVRYNGGVAYVVTFVNTDPLYKLDLSDPANPAVIGELYEEGVSDYLHLVNDNLMIGIGRQAEVDEYGWTRFTGVKVSLYDTSGDTPVILSSYFIESDYSYTPVTYDHKAFVYYEPTGENYMYFVIPVEEYTIVYNETNPDWYYGYAYSGNAYVFKAYYDGTLEFVSKLTHYIPDSENPWYSYYDSIDRTVIISHYIYTVSYSKIQMYDMNNGFELMNQTELESDYYWGFWGYALVD